MSASHLGAGLAIAATLACSPGDARLEVTGRVDGPSGRRARPAHPMESRTLAQATRVALAAPLGAGFEVSVEGRDRHVFFSLARQAPEDCDAAVAFSIAGRFGSSWRLLFSEEVGGGEPRWLDRRLELGGGRRPDRLRFATAGVGARTNPCGAAALPAWGSIVFVGRGGSRLGRGASHPNVILLSLDTLGAAYLGSFGSLPEVSPNLDAFLAEGFSFRRAYAQYGYTLPSHASLFSGLYPIHHGVYRPAPGVEFESLVGRLARHGYATAAFTEGAMVSATFGFARGFDWYEEGDPDLAAQLAGRAALTFSRAGDWLERNARDTRFFLFVHTYEVHLPYLPRDAEARAIARRLTPGVDRFFRGPAQMRASWRHNRGVAELSERELAHLRALHSAEIHHLDRVVAGFLEQLAALGLQRDTLVVLTADHGDQFGEHGKVSHGESLHNRVLQVPLGFRWPARIEAGASEAPVQLVDVMPTVLELAGIEPPASLDGRSLAPLLGGGEQQPRAVFSEQRHARGECVRRGLPDWCRLDRYSVQTDRFKLVRSRLPPEEILYDLREDPLEERDVAAVHPEEVLRLRALLEAYVADAPPEPEAAPAALDDALLERLRELGYVD